MSNKIIKLSKSDADKIFPSEKDVSYDKLLITTEGLYSVSKIRAAKKLKNIIYKYFKTYDIKITDACANVGSDTLMLAKYFAHVNSIELEETNYDALKNNVEVYNYKNIDIINGNNLKELHKLQQDVIYDDPPWGGSSYKNYAQLKIYFDNIELADFFYVLKVMLNYIYIKFRIIII